MHFAKASLREGGGTRSVTEGAYGAMKKKSFHRNAFSLSRLRRQLPPGGSLSRSSPYTDKLQFVELFFNHNRSAAIVCGFLLRAHNRDHVFGLFGRAVVKSLSACKALGEIFDLVAVA